MWYMRSVNIVHIRRIGLILIGIRGNILFCTEGGHRRSLEGVSRETVHHRVDENNREDILDV